MQADSKVDPRGPIENAGMRVSVSPGSVQVGPGYRFKNDGAKPGPWVGKWIWLSRAADGEKPTVGLFRKSVRLPSTPSRARVWVSADVSYRLYVNGKLVARGPADVGRDYDREEHGPQWHYDFREVSGLRAGENVISAEVFTEDFGTWRVSRGKHGLLFEAELDFADGPPVTVASDESWVGVPDGAWHGAEFDASRELVGWRLAGFDDRSWARCSPVESVWTPLVASQIPPMMEARYPGTLTRESGLSALPVRIEGPNAVYTLTYDRILAAYPTLKIDGVSGATVRIVPGERAGDVSRVCILKLRDGVQVFEYPFYDSFSVLRLEFSGIPAGKSVTLLDAGANFTSQPVRYEGSFECSDAHLNELWATCRWLTQICMQDRHLDSPNHQEPIADPGDYLIESQANYYAFGTPWLARQDLRKFGLMLRDLNYRNFHTSYSLLWLQMLLMYYDYTGDADLVRELAPEVHGLLDTFRSWLGKNGLISEAPNYMFMDWVTITGFECHHPPAVIGQGYMTALYYRGLQDGLRIARLMNDAGRASSYETLRHEVLEAFNRELWNPGKGLYRDGKPRQTSVAPYQWLPADKDIETFSPHVNTLAVLFGLAPEGGSIMDRVASEKPLNCQPYFMYFVLEALKKGGGFELYALPLIRQWKIRPDTKTFHEMWDSGDLSHAWGSAPMIQMSSTILGVRPLTSGFGRISIRPLPAGLLWAKGAVPTPHGPVSVSWKRQGRRFQLEAHVPRGCVAEVSLPGAGAGPLIWGPGRHRSTVLLILP